ncbi:hypothetical protein PROFUN_10450 [Planoprotostelium fungivorum]|uniref:Uncharacterized protein n=1 Tax=Planoprotostelium fungivorum TaxID=1890364 RepID=A0A2P6NDZ9_9EUKA|nr:hypothetical protein PROFUN_10450 [Planoprotostelium fungivorum]
MALDLTYEVCQCSLRHTNYKSLTPPSLKANTNIKDLPLIGSCETAPEVQGE